MTLSLGRVLYRGLLRSSKRIDAQIQRHGTVDVFPEVRNRMRRVSKHSFVRDLVFLEYSPNAHFPFPTPRRTLIRVPPPQQAECARLREILPGYKSQLAVGSANAVDALVRVSFRHGSDADVFIDEVHKSRESGALAEERARAMRTTTEMSRLDDAIAAHALLRRRAVLLEGMAAESNSDVTSSDGVRVAVRAALVPEMSVPAENAFVFSYTVSIQNVACDEPVQLVSRHWVIQDEDGNTEEVRGTGVVGFQPVLEKGTSFEYTSQAPLRALKGSMGGSFCAVGQVSGRVMEVPVGDFALGPPKRGAKDVAAERDEASSLAENDTDATTKKAKGKGRKVDRTARLAR
jgi:ApaG protein